MYQNITQSIHKAASDALGKKEDRTSNKPWWTKEIEDLVKEKKQKYMKWLGTKDQRDKDKYEEIRRTLRRTVNLKKKTKCGIRNAKK